MSILRNFLPLALTLATACNSSKPTDEQPHEAVRNTVSKNVKFVAEESHLIPALKPSIVSSGDLAFKKYLNQAIIDLYRDFKWNERPQALNFQVQTLVKFFMNYTKTDSFYKPFSNLNYEVTDTGLKIVLFDETLELEPTSDFGLNVLYNEEIHVVDSKTKISNELANTILRFLEPLKDQMTILYTKEVKETNWNKSYNSLEPPYVKGAWLGSHGGPDTSYGTSPHAFCINAAGYINGMDLMYCVVPFEHDKLNGMDPYMTLTDQYLLGFYAFTQMDRRSAVIRGLSGQPFVDFSENEFNGKFNGELRQITSRGVNCTVSTEDGRFVPLVGVEPTTLYGVVYEGAVPYQSATVHATMMQGVKLMVAFVVLDLHMERIGKSYKSKKQIK